jgi:DNA-binding MarR family transcriptional regulator
MERAGLVERVVGVDDRRTRFLQLSAHGLEMMRSRKEERVGRAEQALAKLTEEQRCALLHLLEKLLDASIATAPEIPTTDPAGIRQEQS